MHLSKKTYGHEQGLSACFRQWQAKSHCRYLHGYALSVSLCFQAATLDGRGWVVDFGGLKPLKEKIVGLLDHKTLIAADDPDLECFMLMHDRGVLDLTVCPGGVGCEAFAQRIYGMAEDFLAKSYLPTLREMGIKVPQALSVHSCTVAEHGANGAIFVPTAPRMLTGIEA